MLDPVVPSVAPVVEQGAGGLGLDQDWAINWAINWVINWAIRRSTESIARLLARSSNRLAP
ncbi:hypothetical protein AMR42_19035 [Limnothrix sp. PR1529]|nr:hypothetical protein BCR12_13145 [Limnothrix sp. P13C2]PIB03420.1 hypothetical protein AMR42_19035 [Limnothrix sp. PR1529]